MTNQISAFSLKSLEGLDYRDDDSTRIIAVPVTDKKIQSALSASSSHWSTSPNTRKISTISEETEMEFPEDIETRDAPTMTFEQLYSTFSAMKREYAALAHQNVTQQTLDEEYEKLREFANTNKIKAPLPERIIVNQTKCCVIL